MQTEPRPGGTMPDAADERSPARALGVRTDDLEPYLALQYIARMLKLLAVLAIVGLVVEASVGFATEGAAVLVPILAQSVQFLMLAAGLWGAADLTRVVIDVGHDIRAERILLGRMAARTAAERDRQGR